jgi:hypothetical protein
MNIRRIGRPSWSTSCFGEAGAGPGFDRSTLGAHLRACRASHGRLFGLRCAAEALDGFLSARVVTSVTLGVLLVGVGSLLA